MNLKDVAKRMNRKDVYRWGVSAIGRYQLFNTKSGALIYSTGERYEAEVVTKKLRGMKMNIVGDIPVWESRV